MEIFHPHLESIYSCEYVDGVRAEDSEHSHVDVVLLKEDNFYYFTYGTCETFSSISTYQETEVNIGAKEWAEDDWNHDVRPVAGDVVHHEERKRCHGWQ